MPCATGARHGPTGSDLDQDPATGGSACNEEKQSAVFDDILLLFTQPIDA